MLPRLRKLPPTVGEETFQPTSGRDYKDHKSITRMATFVIPIVLIKNNINDVHPIGQMGSN